MYASLRWICAFLITFIFSQTVSATLMITPSRVVLDERNRTAELTLINSTSQKRTYRLAFEEMSQNELGQYKSIEVVTPEHRIASPMLRYSPRQVTIEPGKNQRIRIRFRQPANLADGEYRSHLFIKAQPLDPSLYQSNDAEEEQGGLSMKMMVAVSYSLPVIVRKGYTESKVDIGAVNFVAAKTPSAKSMLSVDLTKEGNFSSYGRLLVDMQVNNGKIEQIGRADNVSIFREVSRRNMQVPLFIKQIPVGAVVRIRYEGDDEFKGKTLATSSFRYQP